MAQIADAGRGTQWARLNKGRFGIIMLAAAIALALGGLVLARFAFPLKYHDSLIDNARRHRLDPPLLAAIVYEESKFDPGSKSSAGAIGLMQLMPETAGWAAGEMARPELADSLTKPAANLTLGSWYYRYLLDKYEDERLALAAYNGGERNLDDWLAGSRGRDPDTVVEGIPFDETKKFVRRVQGTKRIYRLLYPGLR